MFMKQEFKQLFPQWIHSVSSNDKLILTNDIDSLFSCAILKALFGCEVGAFFDFKTLYNFGTAYKGDQLIGVDCAVEYKDLRTFCNHQTRFNANDRVNPNSANPNSVQTYKKYYAKYGMSTLMLILSLYDAWDLLLIPGHEELTYEQKVFLWAVDSSYKGYTSYPTHTDVYKSHIWYQEMLGLDHIVDVLVRHTEPYTSVQKTYGLSDHINVIDGKLHTDIEIEMIQALFPRLDLSLPKEEVIEKCRFDTFGGTFSYMNKNSINDLFSLAITSPNYYVCSKLITA
ncbi:hypothetical protein ACQCN2_03540 [Brevibacillus ginsengisoli]|uniref:hypothetical protein n=1 Tax=Brevibacillus ginsengisoli TaxID=363854 RepID=UPI003CF5414E